MHTSRTLLSVVAFLIALAAWVGVWFLFSDVSTRFAARTQLLSSLNAQGQQRDNAAAFHALAVDTASGRAQLDESVTTDIVGIANAISAAGNAAGVQTTIGSASVVGSQSTLSGVSELDFVVQSTGSFDHVWRAAQLFETLPIPSSVSELDFEQLPNTGKGVPAWQLTAHIDVLTSSQVSS